MTKEAFQRKIIISWAPIQDLQDPGAHIVSQWMTNLSFLQSSPMFRGNSVPFFLRVNFVCFFPQGQWRTREERPFPDPFPA